MLWIGMFTGENFLQVSDILVGNYILVGALEHEFYDFHILGISSSQLTNSYFSD